MNIRPYTTFNGTAARSEFWGVWFTTVGAMMLSIMVSGVISSAGKVGAFVAIVLLMVVMVTSAIANFATCARRCRDAAISPWFTLATVIPYVGLIVWVVIGCLGTVRMIDEGNDC
jgi:uncharacterized membrane protein YhaH (DUF805 family)